MLDFGLSPQWELTINLIFLAATGYITLHGIRYRDKEGNSDYVRLLFACIAAVFFFMVLFQDVLGVIKLG